MTEFSLNEDMPRWKSIARRKKVARDSRIVQDWRLKPKQVSDDQLNVINVPSQCGTLTTRELEITGLNAHSLAKRIVNHEYTSYEVCCLIILNEPPAKINTS